MDKVAVKLPEVMLLESALVEGEDDVFKDDIVTSSPLRLETQWRLKVRSYRCSILNSLFELSEFVSGTERGGRIC